jgi:hypothetical protein
LAKRLFALASVSRLGHALRIHAQSVPPVRQPVPAEHALGTKDDVVAKWGDDLQQRLEMTRQGLVVDYVAGGIEHTEV